MITLHPKPQLHNAKNLNTPSFARRSKIDTLLTGSQIRTEASRILSGGLSVKTWYLLDMLATGGVMQAAHLPDLSERSLRHLGSMRLVERISHDPLQLQENFQEIGLEVTRPMLYTLGPVGVEIMTTRHGIAPAGGYQAYTSMRLMHDVAVNEIVLRLAEVIGGRGWTVDWLGAQESVLFDKNRNVVLEPDAIIRFRKEGKDGGDGAFVVEYHNEDWQTRAALKVEKYERAVQEGNWRERWEVETFPPVLVVFWKPIVGAGYQAALKGNRKFHCSYYGKPLELFLGGKLDEWVNIAAGMKKEAILPK